MADSAWQVILQSTRNYINTAWSQQIVPYYTTNLSNAYPLFKKSTRDISIDKLNAFFVADGIADKFFSYYIKPFVNLDDVYWQWKNVYGHNIGFSQKSLEIFMRAALIQKM